jgi:hypothetical protein
MTFYSMAFVLDRRLSQSYSASLEVRVPRVGDLLTASFRSYLAVGTLAVRLLATAVFASQDFHLEVNVHAERTILDRVAFARDDTVRCNVNCWMPRPVLIN